MNSSERQERISIALGYWRDWMGSEGCRPLPRQALGDWLTTVLDDQGQAIPAHWHLLAHGPLLMPARRLLALKAHQQPARLGVLPQLADVDQWLDDLSLRHAEHGGDQPRSLAERELELTEQMAASPVLAGLLGVASPSTQAQLAAEWVGLFDRWDWLIAGWQVLGSPTAQPVVLEGLDWLVDLYLALGQADHGALWHRARGSSPAASAARAVHSPASPRLAYWGVPDALRYAQVLVATGDPPLEAVIAPEIHDPTVWQSIWPELGLVLEGRWSAPATWPSLPSRRLTLEGLVKPASWPPAIRWSKTKTMERGVQLANQQIRRWRAEGRSSIAVVPADRRAARRLAAVLAHGGVGVDDPSGWSMETTLAASGLEALLEVLSADPSLGPIYDWVSNPLVIRGLSAAGLLGEDGLSGLHAQLRAWAKSQVDRAAMRRLDGLPAEMARRMTPLAQSARSQQLPLAQWLADLTDLIDGLGLRSVWAEDEAGLRILSALGDLRARLGPQAHRLSWTGFRAVLRRHLSAGRLPIRAHEAQVHFMSLAEASLASVDGLILLGAAEGQFLERSVSRLVSRETRLALEARPDSLHEEALLWASLSSLLERGTPALVWAQAAETDIHQMRWASGLARLRLMLPGCSLEEALLTPEPIPAAAPPLADAPPVISTLPASLSVSAVEDLARCPYLFFWKVTLGLADWEDLDQPAGSGELGSLLHRLVQAAQQGPRGAASGVLSTAPADWLLWLRHRLDGLAAELPLGPGGRLDLEGRLPKLAEWLAEAAASHGLVTTEEKLATDLPASGRRLGGRLDWLDQPLTDTHTGLRLVDFKTTEPDNLKKKIKEDQAGLQLQAYAEMLARRSRPVAEAGFVAVGRRSTQWFTASLAQTPAEEVLPKIDGVLARILQGEALHPLEAQGSGRHCQSCPAKGCCRAADLSDEAEGALE